MCKAADATLLVAGFPYAAADAARYLAGRTSAGLASAAAHPAAGHFATSLSSAKRRLLSAVPALADGSAGSLKHLETVADTAEPDSGLARMLHRGSGGRVRRRRRQASWRPGDGACWA